MGFASRNPPIGIGRTASGGLRGRLVEAALSGLMLDFALGEYWLRGRRYSTLSSIPGFTYTRSGTAYDLAGTTSFGANVPRRTRAGLLVEAGATNLARSTEDLSAYWSLNNFGSGSLPTVTANAGVAPDGSATAERVVFARTGTTTGDRSFIRQPSMTVTAGVDYVFSIWLRSTSGAQTVVGFANWGTAGAASTWNVTETWQRFSVTANTNAATTAVADIGLGVGGVSNSVTGADVLAWGAQMELGTVPTSYVPNPSTVASASRGADAASVTFTQALPYSVIAIYSAYANLLNPRVVGFDGGTQAPIVFNATQVLTFNGTGSASVTATSVGNRIRAAMANNTSDVAICANGGAVGTSTQSVTGSTTVWLGSQNGSVNHTNGWLELAAILPRRITNTELQNATA